MTLLGTIQKGVVVLEDSVVLPEGTVVEVHVPDEVGTRNGSSSLLKYAGIVTDLPETASQSVDQVLYGAPRE